MYHINPETGNPWLCRASGKCGLVKAKHHYETKVEAIVGLELRMQVWSAYLASLPNLSSVATCKSCGSAIAPEVHAEVLWHHKIFCECGESLTVTKLNVPVRPSSAHLLTLSGAQGARLFHATGRRGWKRILKTDSPIHVGEIESAIDRALTYYHRPSGDIVWGLYELRLKPTATKGRRLRDVGSGMKSVQENGLKGDYNPYINCYEAPGTVSAFIPAKALELVNVKPIRFREILESKSLYNLVKE